MHILKRIGYYLGGFSIGLVILAFFLSGKKTSCAYFPEERVLKSLRLKPYQISPEAEASLTQMQGDSILINRLLKMGSVNFSESETRRKPCGFYVIYGKRETGEELKIELENCEKLVTIKSVTSVDN